MIETIGELLGLISIILLFGLFLFPTITLAVISFQEKDHKCGIVFSLLSLLLLFTLITFIEALFFDGNIIMIIVNWLNTPL